MYPSNFDFDFSVFLLSFVALPLALCFKHSMGSHNVGPRNRAKEESELTHTHLSFKLWLWLVCFFIVLCGIASGSVLQTQHGVTQCWAEEQSQRRVWINTYSSILQTLTLTCLFFIVFCGIASGSVLQTQHGVTQCWAEEQSQRRVWINTYPSILQTLTLTCLFFYCLLWHCLGLCASNTAWGHTMLGRGTEPKKSLN